MRPVMGAFLMAVIVTVSARPGGATAVPTYARDFPDPFVILVDGRYYAYATQSGSTNLQAMSSTDLVDWTSPSEALPVLPGWARRGATWAPGVLSREDRWVLYYTARHRASGRQCISTAVADRPEGPFVDTSSEPFICQLDRGGSIDASPFVDEDGTAYLYWKSDDNALHRSTSLWGQQLAPDGLSLVGPTLQVEQDQPWESPLIEGPAMVKDRASGAAGAYHLFYGGNWWESASAAIGYAVCETALGPCQKATTAGPWMASSSALAGPGGPAFFTDAEGSLAFGLSRMGSVVGGLRVGGRPVAVGRARRVRRRPPRRASGPGRSAGWPRARVRPHDDVRRAAVSGRRLWS